MISQRVFQLATTLFLGVATVYADTWQIDPAHSAAQFSVKHMGISTVRGAFSKVSGTIQYDTSDPTKSALDVTIEATSIDTRVEMRDKDLRSDKWFDTQKYPTITFKSTKVESAGSGKLKVEGNLTMHGVTKPVTLDVEGPSEPIKDRRGLRMGASATTKLNRTDFGVGTAAGMVGTDIAITIDTEMIKPSATAP